MGSCCVKPVPDIQVDIEGNTCFDDIECTSTCCIVKKKIRSPKHNRKHRDPRDTLTIDTTIGEPGV